MALADYTPVLAWFADGLTDLDIPTGTTPSNPSGLTDPTIAGTGDQYADCDGSDGIIFTPGTPVNEVGTGDVTIVGKFRVDTLVSGDVLFENFDGGGATGNPGDHGFAIELSSSVAGRIRLIAPPDAGNTAAVLNGSADAFTAGQDFIVAWKRTSGTWTMFIDLDASGGMAAITASTNSIGARSFGACGGIAFGSRNSAANPFDGRVYWLVTFDEALLDADLLLAAWDDEANLKAAWVGGGGGTAVPVFRHHYMVMKH